MGKYFGTDGFRGEANEKLTVEHAFIVGRYIGYYYGKSKKCSVVIGKDTRKSSYMFENALSAGLTASGADVYLLHVTTTPSVSYVTRTEDFDCGIMISASHNPYYDNGIKLLNQNGEKMDDAFIEELEAYLDDRLSPHHSVDIPYATRDDIGRTIDYSAGRNRYTGYLISLATHSYKGMRVGLDCSNGSTWMIAKSVFDALGADTYVIHNNPNGTNINAECGSTHMRSLQRFVLDNKLDIGFAFDGDADRCLAVDEKGEIVNGDMIMYLYSAYMKKRDKLTTNTVVTTIMSNFGLYKALDKLDIGYEKTAVGDRFVYENMRENGHLIGGEQSGHIIFLKYANTGDGMLTAIKVMQAMLDQKLPLSKLVEPITMYPQVLKNVSVSSKEETLADIDVQNAVAQAGEALGDNGRILLRASGTEPVLRVMVEAASPEICEQYVDFVIAVMKQKGYVL